MPLLTKKLLLQPQISVPTTMLWTEPSPDEAYADITPYSVMLPPGKYKCEAMSGGGAGGQSTLILESVFGTSAWTFPNPGGAGGAGYYGAGTLTVYKHLKLNIFVGRGGRIASAPNVGSGKGGDGGICVGSSSTYTNFDTTRYYSYGGAGGEGGMPTAPP